ncbi:hypothetical protein ScPMuIL_017383 [Solemya velum]
MSGRKVLQRSGNIPEYNLALVGALGVGKSALTVKYITRRFIMEYDPDIGESSRGVVRPRYRCVAVCAEYTAANTPRSELTYLTQSQWLIPLPR